MEDSLDITPEMMESNPLLALVAGGFGLIVMGVLSGILLSIVLLITRFVKTKVLLPIEPWTPRKWSFLDIFLIIVGVFLMQFVFAGIGALLVGGQPAAVDGEAPLRLDFVLIVSIGNIAAMIAGVLLITTRYGVGADHIGFVSKKPLAQVATGLMFGLATLPIIWVLMALVSTVFANEYSHPLIDAMSGETGPWSYIFGFITAAIIAPITEEFAFRVVLQGWLQSIPFKSAMNNLIGIEPDAMTPQQATVEMPLTEQGSESDLQDIGEQGSQPFAPPQSLQPIDDAVQAEVIEPTVTPPIWPIFVTGLLFGLAHFDYGLSWVPLTVLGISLGFVYRATHSVWPCIIMHMCLNGFSMMSLGFLLLMQSMQAS